MATFNKGILGGYSRKVGNLVGSSWRGKNVLRSLATKGNRVFAQSQLDQQEKFGLMYTCFNSMLNFVFNC